MKNVAVTLESLDQKIDSGLKHLDQKIDSGLKHLDQKIDAGLETLNNKIDAGLAYVNKKIDNVDVKIDEVLAFLTEHMMMRGEIEQHIEAKFSKYTWNQLDFQDQVAKRCENNEHENLGLHHRVTRLEKHVGI